MRSIAGRYVMPDLTPWLAALAGADAAALVTDRFVPDCLRQSRSSNRPASAAACAIKRTIIRRGMFATVPAG
jgi:hypothetical protein